MEKLNVSDRITTIRQYNPHLSGINPQSPLSVGNGRFCFTADITGMQTLYDEYLSETPLCTMAEWAWHTTYDGHKEYTLDDVRMTEYDYLGRTVSYPRVKFEGNEDAYNWVRMNPHKFNLARIGLTYNNEYISSDNISDISQTLDLTTGILHSEFNLSVDSCDDIKSNQNYTPLQHSVNVETMSDDKSDTLVFKISSSLLNKPNGLGVDIHFPYASCDITGSDWNSNDKHYDDITISDASISADKIINNISNTISNSTVNNIDRSTTSAIDTQLNSHSISNADTRLNNHKSPITVYQINRTLEDTHYSVFVKCNGVVTQTGKHRYHISGNERDNTLYLCINFKDDNNIYQKLGLNISDNCRSFFNNCDCTAADNYNQIVHNSSTFWNNYWNSGKFLYHENNELMRRVILSQYLLVINDSGYIPPAETGLTCNSWYGKAHLEMHYWHMAWAALWGHPEMLERSFDWYISILPEARANAAHNGYKGARWTKMVSYTGKDCPSKIAPLLVWQQPHIINMLQMVLDCYKNASDKSYSDEYINNYMNKYWILVKETAEFIEDFLVYDISTDSFNIESPVIPVQERHLPEETRNPIFELAYFRYGLKIASEWADSLNHVTLAQNWNNIANRIAPLPVADGCYISQENCPETFISKAIDHPLMLQVYGMLDTYGAKDIVDIDIYKATLNKVIDVWDYSTLWGWDFAVIAMAADKLGLKDTALNQLLIESPKNEYVVSGNNRQNSRKDLPLYLPGNGSLLVAVAKMYIV